MKKILLVVPYPKNEAPSQRFRFEQFISRCTELEFDHKPFLDQKTWEILYKPGHITQKVSGILRGFLRRSALLFSLHKYDFIFIHREATPLGPPVWEFLAAKVFRKKIIYDFDDAIWLPNTSEQNKIAAALKAHWKVKHICKWAYKVSCGNHFLKGFAAQFNTNAVFLPTTIDMDYHFQPEKKENNKTIIGWTGSHSTMGYIKLLVPVLEELKNHFDFSFLLISNQNADFYIPNKEYVKWTKEDEIRQLSRIDIGVMPLKDTIWENGKCGFKALQYMALSIPCVAAHVGANKEIITDGENGFLCNTEEEWFKKISYLLKNPVKSKETGSRGQEHIRLNYSITANYNKYLKLFR